MKFRKQQTPDTLVELKNLMTMERVAWHLTEYCASFWKFSFQEKSSHGRIILP